MTGFRFLPLTGCVLLLAACGSGGPAVVLPPAQTVSSVSGVVVEDSSTDRDMVTTAWTGGAGKVSGRISYGSGDAATTEVVTTGSVAQDGSFTLDLPESVDSAKLHAFTGSFFNTGGRRPPIVARPRAVEIPRRVRRPPAGSRCW